MSSWLNARAARTLADIDLRNPLTDHPLNQGRVAWWLALPGRYGGPIWWDLVSGLPGTLTGFTAGYGWSASSYPGEAGSIYLPGSNSYVSAALPVDVVENWSIAFSIRQTVVSGTGVDVIAGTRHSCGDSFDTKFTSATNIHADLGTGSTWLDTALDYTSPTSLTGRWVRLLYALGPAGGTIFIDGLPAVTHAWTGTPLLGYRGSSIYFGMDADGAQGIIGNLDNISIWGRKLDAAEARYDSQLGPQGVLRRRRRTAYSVPSVTPGGVVFRKSLSGIGTRVGKRQPQRLWGGL